MKVTKDIFKSATAKLPTKNGCFEIYIYKSQKENLEHAVLIKRSNTSKIPLVRIHSSCLTGDVFSSLRCDCQEQLISSLKKISKSKYGILLYLNQEGRGIGLTNKIKAYSLQENGLDTVQANEQLGFAADERNYSAAAAILSGLKVFKINLLTNNPDKLAQLKKFGIVVEKCIPLETLPNHINKKYLKTKKYKLGHKLKLV